MSIPSALYGYTGTVKSSGGSSNNFTLDGFVTGAFVDPTLMETQLKNPLNINTQTTEQLDVNRLQGFPTNANQYLRGDGTWANFLVDINAQTINPLNINRLQNYPNNNTVFLRGDGAWTQPSITVDLSNTTGSLNINRLQNYPNNNTVFLRGDGAWRTPFLNIQTETFDRLDINARTTGQLNTNRLQNIPYNSNYFLSGSGSWLLPNIDINTQTNQQLNINRLQGYPNDSTKYLRGDGTWVQSTATPYINDLPINGNVNLQTYNISTTGEINCGTGTFVGNNLRVYSGFDINVESPLYLTQGPRFIYCRSSDSLPAIVIDSTNVFAKAGFNIISGPYDYAAEFGYEGSTQRAYVSGHNGIDIGTSYTKRIEVLGGESKTVFISDNNNGDFYIRPSRNFFDYKQDSTHNGKNATILETNALNESAAFAMNGDYIQSVQTFDDLGFIFSDRDFGTFSGYQSYIASDGFLVVSSDKQHKHSLAKQTFTGCLEKLNKLQVYTYGRKHHIKDSDSLETQSRKYHKHHHQHFGLMADEVEAILDHATDHVKLLPPTADLKHITPLESRKEHLERKNKRPHGAGIKYDAVVCYLLLGIKELSQKLTNIEKQIGLC